MSTSLNNLNSAKAVEVLKHLSIKQMTTIPINYFIIFFIFGNA